MPPLERPQNERLVHLKPRTAVVAAAADVLVVGGGPAGLGAALGAAGCGADVILAERYGFLGGNATVSLVMPLMSFHNEVRSAREVNPDDSLRLLPQDHGPGRPVVGGVLNRLLSGLLESGGAVAPAQETGYTVPFDPEVYKTIALELLDEAGVRFLFHAFASEVYEEDQAHGVVFETKSGPIVIEADVVVDCTGDGDVAAAAGAEYEVGRETDGLAQPMTLMFRMVDFGRPAFAEYVASHPDQWRGVHGLWDLVKRARDAGELNLPREDVLFFATPHSREVSVNSTRIQGRLATDVWDLTAAEYEGRRQLQMIERFLRKEVPGFEDSYVAQSSTSIGIRESRRIVGEYLLTESDILDARPFDDAIALGSYPIDIHSPTGSGTTLRRLPPGSAYDIPLRSLLPRGIAWVMVAGRCISGTHEALSSYRVTPIAMATGQAAGVCAALAARVGSAPREVDPRSVQRELLAQGALLRDDLSEAITAGE